MLENGAQFISKDLAHISLVCNCCGKTIGCYGWNKEEEFNEVKENGWNYCPYCGEALGRL